MSAADRLLDLVIDTLVWAERLAKGLFALLWLWGLWRLTCCLLWGCA